MERLHVQKTTAYKCTWWELMRWRLRVKQQLECALCGDATPCTPTQKAKLLWTRDTMGQVSRKCHFTFSFDSALCKWGVTFTGNYIMWHPLHCGTIFHPQATTLTLTLTLTPGLLNPKSIASNRLSRTTTVPGFTSFRWEIFDLLC